MFFCLHHLSLPALVHPRLGALQDPKIFLLGGPLKASYRVRSDIFVQRLRINDRFNVVYTLLSDRTFLFFKGKFYVVIMINNLLSQRECIRLQKSVVRSVGRIEISSTRAGSLFYRQTVVQ